MSLPSFSVRNSVLVNMLMVAILVAGLLFALTLTREMFPETRPDKIAITTIYPGVQPAEIEKAVTIKIEEAIRDVEGIEKIDSVVANGVTSTIATLLNEVDDVDTVLQEIKAEVDALQELPDEIEQITVRKMEPRLPVISVALFGDVPEAELKRAARNLRDELLRLPGVSDVELSGTRDDEISVEIQPERLLEYDVSFEEVAQAIGRGNLDISGGELKGDRSITTVWMRGEELRGRDLEDLIVRTMPDGRRVHLADLAEIRDTFVESDLESYFNGKHAVHCIVYKTRSQDAIQISHLVKAWVKGKKGEEFDAYGFLAAQQKPWYARPWAYVGAGVTRLLTLISGRPDPQTWYEQARVKPFEHGLNVELHTDLARFVEGRLDLLLRNGRAGLILVLISLVLFLNWRVAFWTAVGLPISFLGTFIVMWAMGVTINLLTMFGLIIVLGIIVDDAIVIGENVYRHVQEGMRPRQAAVHGAEEVMWPVVIAVTTTLAAFTPLMFIRGQIGDFMGQLPLVVLSALSVSLLEALVILPAHLAELPDENSVRGRHGIRARLAGWFDRLQQRFLHGRFRDGYERFLRICLRWRYVTVATAIALVIGSAGLYAGGIVRWEFIQKMDSESIIGSLEMPVGTPADQARERLLVLTEAALQMPEVRHVQMFVARQYDIAGAGATGANDQPHLGQLIIELEAADVRERRGQRSSEELLAELRKVSERLPGVNSITWEALTGGPGGRDIEIRIAGPNFDELVQVAEELKAELAQYEGVFDLDDNHEQGQREIQLQLLAAARPTGLTRFALGDYVRSAVYGKEARRITRNREDVRIMVRYPRRYREAVHHVESMWLPATTSDGSRGWVPLSEIARIVEAQSFTTIHRSQQERSVTVFGEVNDEIVRTDVVLNRIGEAFRNRIQPQHPDVRIEFLGSYQEQTKAFSSLKTAFPVALLLIYTMLAGLFRSYAQPLVVMSAIPFGVEGAILGHWLTNNPMTILSMIGLVALTGIVVNDSLVLVDFINKRMRRGMPPFEASVQGAVLRLRPILLTTLTTVAGLTPLMFETSFQARFLIPMAVTLTFGLMFATALTLIIVPSLNLIFMDIRHIVWGEVRDHLDEPVAPTAPVAATADAAS